MNAFLLEVLPLPNEIVDIIYGFMKVNAANTIGTYFKTSKRSYDCLLYTSPSPRDRTRSRMPSSA